MKTEVVAAGDPSLLRDVVAGGGDAGRAMSQKKAGVNAPGYNSAAEARAVELLQCGEVVALPTETVYGLAADALSEEAVLKIFEAKERPRFDPLIIHLPDESWLERLTNVSTKNREVVSKLVNAFWPGPLTLVLPKTSVVPDIVTAGLDTVALRVSAHPVFHAIVRTFGRPVAAPSANRFGRISPTTATHVMEELNSRIPLIVDAGSTSHGVESTVVLVRDGSVEILRPGPITEEDLCGIGCEPRTGSGSGTAVSGMRAPGQLPSHYAPRTRLRLIESPRSMSLEADQRVGLLAWKHIEDPSAFATFRVLSDNEDLREAAANLFRYLRELDSSNLDLIVAEVVPEHGLGVAINDRLRRAARKTGNSSSALAGDTSL